MRSLEYKEEQAAKVAKKEPEKRPPDGSIAVSNKKAKTEKSFSGMTYGDGSTDSEGSESEEGHVKQLINIATRLQTKELS